MKVIITESKETKLKEILEYLINVQVEDILSNSEGFSWDVQDAIASIDGVEINHMTYNDGIKVWIDIYGYDDTFDFDFLTSEIQYRLRKSFPHLKIFTNEVILQDSLNEQELDLVPDEPIDECVIEIDYTNFGFQYELVYINGIADTPTELERVFNEIKETPGCKVLLHNTITNETFELSSKDIFLTKNKKIYIWKNVFDSKVFPYFPDIVKFESYIKSTNIKKALEIAFKDYWTPSTNEYVAGVVGVKPIPFDKRGWSIVNFFNTKLPIHERMKLFLARDIKDNEFTYDEDDIESSMINWMSDLFRDVDSDDMKQLLDIQLKSIVNNFRQEKLDAEKIRDQFHPGSDIKISGFGTKKDIIDGIDATIDGVTYQIKPLSNIELKDGIYSANIGFSNAVNYSNKPIDRMAFIKGSDVYVFNNSPIGTVGKTYKFKESDLIKLSK